jgi:hypothetical protein
MRVAGALASMYRIVLSTAFSYDFSLVEDEIATAASKLLQ